MKKLLTWTVLSVGLLAARLLFMYECEPVAWAQVAGVFSSLNVSSGGLMNGTFTFGSTIVGNINTASGSDHTPGGCGAGLFAQSIGTNWSLGCNAVSFSSLSGTPSIVNSFNTRTGAVTLLAADVDGLGSITNNTSGSAGSLSGSLTQCPNGATGIAANGNANCISATHLTQSATGTGCSTGASSYDTCESGTVSWPANFADTNYQVSCTANGPSTLQSGCSGAAGCQMGTVAGYTSKSVSGIVVIWATLGGNIATASSFDCVANHN